MGGSRNTMNEMRSRVLEKWVISKGMVVLNDPSEWYTFSEMNRQNGIDVTLVNGVPIGCRFEWEVKSRWGISDHNVVLMTMWTE